jgi:translocating chain-associated membrane protein 1
VNIVNKLLFVATRFVTLVLAVITLFYGIGNTNESKRGLIGLGIVCSLQFYFIFAFITSFLQSKRESQAEQKVIKAKAAKSATKTAEKSKKERKKESDLPEADQQSTPINTKKVKTK